MTRLVVVLPLRQLQHGDGFALRDWPLHVTVVPTFVVDTDLAPVGAAITDGLKSRVAIRVRAGADEGFGRAGTIPVSLVETSAELTALHNALVSAVLGVGAQFDDPDFVGTGYRSHVTMTEADRLHPGDDMYLEQVVIVDMSPEEPGRLRRVVWTAPLHQEPVVDAVDQRGLGRE